MNYIDEMIDSDDNKGILLYVDSPGGAVYQSDELYQKIMEYKKKQNVRSMHILLLRPAPVVTIFPWQQIRFMQTEIAGRVRSVLLYH